MTIYIVNYVKNGEHQEKHFASLNEARDFYWHVSHNFDGTISLVKRTEEVYAMAG